MPKTLVVTRRIKLAPSCETKEEKRSLGIKSNFGVDPASKTCTHLWPNEGLALSSAEHDPRVEAQEEGGVEEGNAESNR